MHADAYPAGCGDTAGADAGGCHGDGSGNGGRWGGGAGPDGARGEFSRIGCGQKEPMHLPEYCCLLGKEGRERVGESVYGQGRWGEGGIWLVWLLCKKKILLYSCNLQYIELAIRTEHMT